MPRGPVYNLVELIEGLGGIAILVRFDIICSMELVFGARVAANVLWIVMYLVTVQISPVA